MNIARVQKAVVAALQDIKARDIAVFPVAHLTQEFDRVIVASAESARQTRALASRVRERAKQAGARICRSEGDEGGDWILVDLGDIVVHIMQPATRALYNLEELWNHPPPKPVARRPRAAAVTAETPAAPRPRAPSRKPRAPAGDVASAARRSAPRSTSAASGAATPPPRKPRAPAPVGTAKPAKRPTATRRPAAASKRQPAAARRTPPRRPG